MTDSERREMQRIVAEAIQEAIAARPAPPAHGCLQLPAINDLSSSVKLLTQQQGQILKMVESHQETLYGNGKPGLKTIVHDLQQSVGAGASVWQRIVEWAIIAGLTAIVALLVQ